MRRGLEFLTMTVPEEARASAIPELMGSAALGGMPYGSEGALLTPHIKSPFDLEGGDMPRRDVDEYGAAEAASASTDEASTRSGPWTDN